MSLTGTYDPTNIFAKILAGDMPCHRVFEDDTALAFLDIFPQSQGHTLVIPKVAARNLLDFPAEHLGPYMARVQRVATAVTTACAPDGVVITQFNGAPAGQTVFHLHFHIIPAYTNTPMATHGQTSQGGPGKANDADLASLAQKIAEAMG